MTIQYVRRADIDDKKWNSTIHYAISSMPYAYTWYLDNVTDNWDGLVMGSYKAVMPIVWKKKWGIHYIYRPPFTQQLGVFSPKPLNKMTIQYFFEAIPHRYKYQEHCINPLSIYENTAHKNTLHANYELILNKSYEQLYQCYHSQTKRAIKKAQKANLHISHQIKPEQLCDFYMKHTAPKIPHFKSSYYYTMLRIVYIAQYYRSGMTLGVYNKKELLSVAFFVFSKQRIIYLLPSSNDKGRMLGSMSLLIDSVIRQYVGQLKTLDFEGSTISSIARYYKGFGAKNNPYYTLHINHLPFYLKWIKK